MAIEQAQKDGLLRDYNIRYIIELHLLYFYSRFVQIGCIDDSNSTRAETHRTVEHFSKPIIQQFIKIFSVMYYSIIN